MTLTLTHSLSLVLFVCLLGRWQRRQALHSFNFNRSHYAHYAPVAASVTNFNCLLIELAVPPMFNSYLQLHFFTVCLAMKIETAAVSSIMLLK